MPRKTTGETRRAQLNIRATAELRERLEAAANSAGRALSHEIEARLSQSFEMDRVLDDLMKRVKQATIQLLADYCDGPENLSVGLRLAQRLSFHDLPADESLAIEDLRSILPKVMAMKPLPLTVDRLTDLVEEAMHDVAFVAPLPNEPEPKPDSGRRPREPIPLPEGLEWEKPENLKLYKPHDPEGDMFKGVVDEAKRRGAATKRPRKP